MTEQEKNTGNKGDRQIGEGIPVCPHCLTPFHHLQHYCEKCGKAVGLYVPYLPYEGIPFNWSIFGEMWKRLRSPKTSWFAKAFYLFMIIVFAAPMLVGVPFLVIGKLRKKGRRTNSRRHHRETE
jgi:hypothetical protein